MEIYERLTRICKKNFITPSELCIQITGSPGNLATWKKGNINIKYLIEIAKKFNVSTDYLLTGKEFNAPDNPLLDLIGQLTDDECEKVAMFIQGMLANRK